MKKNGTITDVLALTVLAVFAVCVLAVLLSGASVYRNLVQNTAEQHKERTAVQYMTTRVRQAQSVSVEPFGGCQSLTLREEIDGETYLTRVYCYEGSIRELFCAETADLLPSDGECIIEAERLSFSLNGAILSVQIDTRSLFLHLPAVEEVSP